MSYWLTRVVFLRCLAAMYTVAFLVALLQNEYLLGEEGLTPATIYIQQRRGGRSNYELVLSHPTVFWVISPSTANINLVAVLGLCLSVFVAIEGCANMPIILAMWALYFSIVSIGQTWYSFGWESQLLETGFLTAFMVPLLSLARFPRHTPTPWVCIWGLRWLLFRIMIGAGMIKIRGDECWRDLTCMNYHYQTQPVPNPLSVYFHNTPEMVHRLETLGNHFVELLCPWLLLLPWRTPQLLGGAVQILFQAVLIASGNLAFLNWLTAIPAVMCFEDAALCLFFAKEDIRCAREAEEVYSASVERIVTKSRYYNSNTTAAIDKKDNTTESNVGITWSSQFKNMLLRHTTFEVSWFCWTISVRRLTGLLLTLWLGVLSYPVVQNILSPHQHMNVSFDPFRMVNSYGAFGSVTKTRHEVILQGTSDPVYASPTAVWRDFDFACKPGNIDRPPCLISPYHIRMDWLMWFAAFQSYQHCPWIVHLCDKLLSGTNKHSDINRLLAPNGNPFASESTEGTLKFMRAELYEYQYSRLSAEQRAKDAAAGWEVGRWWKRKHVQSYMPIIDGNNTAVREFLRAHRLIV